MPIIDYLPNGTPVYSETWPIPEEPELTVAGVLLMAVVGILGLIGIGSLFESYGRSMWGACSRRRDDSGRPESRRDTQDETPRGG